MVVHVYNPSTLLSSGAALSRVTSKAAKAPQRNPKKAFRVGGRHGTTLNKYTVKARVPANLPIA